MYQLYRRPYLLKQLAAQFPMASWPNPIIMNEAYCAMSEDSIVKQFASYMWAFQAARGNLTYQRRGNQCEHYALRAALEIVDLFRQMNDTEIPPEAESIAIAACSFDRAEGKGRHEANLWLIAGVWRSWEPQTREFFTFAETERLSVAEVIVP